MSSNESRNREASRTGLSVEVENLTLAVGERVLLEKTNASFQAGQVTLIVGSSGAGKSTLLRLLAGLIDEFDSTIRVSGSTRFDGSETSSAIRRQDVGVVFQEYALLDELSPLDNVRLARAHRQSQHATGKEPPASKRLLAELHVPEHVRTASLSGGQRQRLAIARALAYEPGIMLYDEPTSGLDAVTASRVAGLIHSTHASHPKTSIVVTHDYEALAPIADRIYLLDPETRSLREIDRNVWDTLHDQLKPVSMTEVADVGNKSVGAVSNLLQSVATKAGDFLVTTARAAMQTLLVPLSLIPYWRSPLWGLRFLAHYLRLVAGPSAWAYIAICGVIVGFVTTYFTFRFLPYAAYTKPLLIEDLLMSMGFALYRILVPVFVTILIAARCGAAVASDVGGKSYGHQIDALRTMGIRPRFYLLTPILYSFLIGAPALNFLGYLAASATALVTFTATHPDLGPDFWSLHFHRQLSFANGVLYAGSGWLLSKIVLCASGTGLIAYHQGTRPKYSSSDVSAAITSSILWATLYVLLVHFAFAFFEFG